MLSRVLSPIQNELLRMEELLEKSFQIKSGHLSSFAHLPAGAVDGVFRPALVLLSAGLFGPLLPQVVVLAAVVQFIYLAVAVHRGIGEGNSPHTPSDPRDGHQFPVLVGDYLYGRFFTSLCDAGIVHYLRPLSEVICQINEGHILRLKSSFSGKNIPWLKVVQLETASLTGAACELGAHLAGAPVEQREILKRFGAHLGMARGCRENGLLAEGENFFSLAEQELAALPAGEFHRAMKYLIECLRKEETAASRLVV